VPCNPNNKHELEVRGKIKQHTVPLNPSKLETLVKTTQSGKKDTKGHEGKLYSSNEAAKAGL
jgi:hypothetical protein